MRAIRYSFTLFAFNEERLLIKLILLYNGLVFPHLLSSIFCDSYPPRYIYIRFKKFFTNKLSPTSIIPLIANPHDFLFLRSYILNRLTTIEHQVASRITKTTDTLKNDTVDDPLARMRLKNSPILIGIQ